MISALKEVARAYELLADSYLATLAIALVISYLGVFVVLKRIVFLGITLAQAAAAGIALAFFAQGKLGHDTALAETIETYGPTAGALGVSTVGVLGFALPGESKRISREALLGLGYALFGGASILLVWVSPKGFDELKGLLAGDIVFARSQLGTLVVGLGIVAALHALLRKEFLLTSYDPEFARTLRMPVRLYEALLALSLGVAVSLALKVAGILLVFAFLSVPPIAGLAIGRKLRESTVVALSVAAAGSWVGLYLSYRGDLPTAPTVACVLVALAGLAWAASKGGDWGRRAFYALLVPLAVCSLASAADAIAAHEGLFRASAPRGVASVTSETPAEDLVSQFKNAGDADQRLAAAQKIAQLSDDRILEAFLKVALSDEDEAIREVALSSLEKFGDRARAARITHRFLRSDDAPVRLHAALGLVRLGDNRGVEALIDLLDDGHAEFGTKDEAHQALLRLAPDGKKFGYDAFADSAANHKAVLAWQDWWRSQSTKVPH